LAAFGHGFAILDGVMARMNMNLRGWTDSLGDWRSLKFADTTRAKIQNPNSKFQTQNSDLRGGNSWLTLEFEVWNLFGFWILDLGIWAKPCLAL
jgi:hypothetical protein